MPGRARTDFEKLAELAQIRADAELKRYAAFRNHLDALYRSREQAQRRLREGYADQLRFSVEEARLGNMIARQSAREVARLDAEIARMAPGCDTARAEAAREFGRVQALRQLAMRDAAKPTGRRAR